MQSKSDRLQSFVLAGAAAQAAVDERLRAASLDEIPSRSRALITLEAIDVLRLDDLQCLSEFDLNLIETRARSLLTIAEFEQGRREGLKRMRADEKRDQLRAAIPRARVFADAENNGAGSHVLNEAEMAMLPNEHHPNPARCSCRECLRAFRLSLKK